MEISELKEYIYDNQKVELILLELGCHDIKYHDSTSKYYSCAYPDGDNKSGLLVYDNDYLNIVSNTRNIVNPFNVTPSLIDVVCFIKEIYISNAIKWVCDVLGLDYYSNPEEELPLSIQWTKMIEDMKENESKEEIEYLKPINEHLLNYYKPYTNSLFKIDGILYSIQREFEIGYDLYSNRITIPIRDEIGTLVGVKGRCFYKEIPNDEDKYIYLEPCAKTRILYGLYKTLPFIKREGKVIIFESEKSVLKAWSDNIYNVVAISGHNLSKTQVEKLTSLGINEIILCYDEDVFRNEETNKVNKKDYMLEVNKFIPQQKVSVMVDIDGILLNKKESPIDDINKFKTMYENRILLR